MPEPGPRVAYWMDVFAEVMLRPRTSLPTTELSDHLERTFAGAICSYNWRDAEGRYGREGRGVRLLADHFGTGADAASDRFIETHPLITWFATTCDPRPWTIGRVPYAMVSRRRRAFVEDALRQVGGEQQVSISYRLNGPMHRAFVLGRAGLDFDDEDLLVAGYVQRALAAMDYQTALVAQLQRSGGIDAAVHLELTGRELAVLRLIGAGAATRVAARRLDCSPRTVEKHLQQIYRKLEVSDRLNAVRVARQAGILP